jgi:hypothetical protein
MTAGPSHFTSPFSTASTALVFIRHSCASRNP